MFLSVKVQDDGNTILPWTITFVGDEDSFLTIYEAVFTGNDIQQQYNHGECITGVHVGESKINLSRAAVDVEKCVAKDICQSFGKYVCF